MWSCIGRLMQWCSSHAGGVGTPFTQADVVDLIKKLGHSSCILVAHDWGAAVAWTVARSVRSWGGDVCLGCTVEPCTFANSRVGITD